MMRERIALWCAEHTEDIAGALLLLALLTLGLMEVTAGLHEEASLPEPVSCEVYVRNPCGDMVPACKVNGPYERGEYDCR